MRLVVSLEYSAGAKSGKVCRIQWETGLTRNNQVPSIIILVNLLHLPGLGGGAVYSPFYSQGN